MATESTTPPRRRSWLVPRFSLRVLLLAFTSFAIGFPIWYRWPYEEVVQLPSVGRNNQHRITTWQRQWGGGRLKHGPDRRLFNGEVVLTTTYRDGKKHGPYVLHLVRERSGKRQPKGVLSLVRSDVPTTIGQYVDDQMEGEWIEADIHGKKIVTTWHNGKQISP